MVQYMAAELFKMATQYSKQTEVLHTFQAKVEGDFQKLTQFLAEHTQRSEWLSYEELIFLASYALLTSMALLQAFGCHVQLGLLDGWANDAHLHPILKELVHKVQSGTAHADDRLFRFLAFNN